MNTPNCCEECEWVESKGEESWTTCRNAACECHTVKASLPEEEMGWRVKYPYLEVFGDALVNYVRNNCDGETGELRDKNLRDFIKAVTEQTKLDQKAQESERVVKIIEGMKFTSYLAHDSEIYTPNEINARLDELLAALKES